MRNSFLHEVEDQWPQARIEHVLELMVVSFTS
jgi:hypothetical protein